MADYTRSAPGNKMTAPTKQSGKGSVDSVGIAYSIAMACPSKKKKSLQGERKDNVALAGKTCIGSSRTEKFSFYFCFFHFAVAAGLLKSKLRRVPSPPPSSGKYVHVPPPARRDPTLWSVFLSLPIPSFLLPPLPGFFLLAVFLLAEWTTRSLGQ